ncbi:helix-turn-helix transcriptional regulator [Hymenobacter norwichensis]|uniref:helix-turn-helix transcriptional regulator n=1 Tax=Hymenobacter norwichensis TaxID=223903 RepID=UPI0003B60D8F|nr:AraC family transcriptional regulator [Hymenobacter norwichensis]
MSTPPFATLSTVADFTRHYGFPVPAHPLVTVVDLAQHPPTGVAAAPAWRALYVILLKRHFDGQLPYGQQEYDYQPGELGFYAPGQPVTFCPAATQAGAGWLVVFHPDLLGRPSVNSPLGRYPFFSYRVRQALALSAADEQRIRHAVLGLRQESELPADAFSQQLLGTQLEVLLQVANRAYHRQFPTEPVGGPDLLSRFEALLATYQDHAADQPLPTVQHLAEALHVAPAYLGEVLRRHTGQNAQQHLHAALLEKARQLLLSTPLSVREVAFRLGFESPSYLGRLFKQKTGLTPTEFKQLATEAALAVPA